MNKLLSAIIGIIIALLALRIMLSLFIQVLGLLLVIGLIAAIIYLTYQGVTRTTNKTTPTPHPTPTTQALPREQSLQILAGIETEYGAIMSDPTSALTYAGLDKVSDPHIARFYETWDIARQFRDDPSTTDTDLQYAVIRTRSAWDMAKQRAITPE